MTASAVAVVGPTASGKSSVAMAVAQADGDVELVSVDSMQVYRGMDIGTAKPSADDRARVPHHLIDVIDPTDEFAVAEFQSAYRSVIAEIGDRGTLVQSRDRQRRQLGALLRSLCGSRTGPKQTHGDKRYGAPGPGFVGDDN